MGLLAILFSVAVVGALYRCDPDGFTGFEFGDPNTSEYWPFHNEKIMRD